MAGELPSEAGSSCAHASSRDPVDAEGLSAIGAEGARQLPPPRSALSGLCTPKQLVLKAGAAASALLSKRGSTQTTALESQPLAPPAETNEVVARTPAHMVEPRTRRAHTAQGKDKGRRALTRRGAASSTGSGRVMAQQSRQAEGQQSPGLPQEMERLEQQLLLPPDAGLAGRSFTKQRATCVAGEVAQAGGATVVGVAMGAGGIVDNTTHADSIAVLEIEQAAAEDEEESEEAQTMWQAAFTFLPVFFEVASACIGEIVEAGVCQYLAMLAVPVWAGISYLFGHSVQSVRYTSGSLAPPPPPRLPPLSDRLIDATFDFAESHPEQYMAILFAVAFAICTFYLFLQASGVSPSLPLSCPAANGFTLLPAAASRHPPSCLAPRSILSGAQRLPPFACSPFLQDITNWLDKIRTERKYRAAREAVNRGYSPLDDEDEAEAGNDAGGGGGLGC